ncbi:MAG: hypothetical protein JNL65_11435 [Saprospiraceae bacterium]|nr:hypothetical protein [Saprospiraceae bacterium]
MEQDLTFDRAIELLEITDIAKISINDIPNIAKKAKKRWHPDRVAHLKDVNITKEYTVNFQQIDGACELISNYLNGTYKAGEAFSSKTEYYQEEPEEVIRKNANNIQTTLKNLWETIKGTKYRHSIKEVLLSDGYRLKDLLHEDFKEDIAMLSIVSFFYGAILIGILAAIGSAIDPAIGTLISIFGMFQVLSCFLGLLPLSRFWLPQQLQEIMLWFINFGLGVYNWAERESSVAAWWVQILVAIPNLFALAIKYIILFPLTEIAKAIVQDKVVGVVKDNVNYYADVAEWYIQDLLNKHPNEMSRDELFHLSYLYTELSDINTH